MMRARNRVIGVLGAVLGVLLAVGMAVAPASARQPGGTITSTLSCASFEGLSVTAPSVRYSGVGLHTGEVISVTVSPAASADSITLFASIGLSFIYGGGSATQTYSFRAPYDSVYDLSWAYVLADNSTSSLNRTWKFDCSTASGTTAPPVTTDDDRDGVANSSDVCSGTTLPDSVSRPAAGSYYANASKNFVDGAGHAANITVADTGGCSAAQISKALGLGKNQSRSGVSLSTLTSWANSH
jgi:hypothetical protein